MIVQAGDIAFSGKRSNSFYSRVVMWATKSKWSHCFPIIGEAMGELSVLEADLDVTMVSFQQMYVNQDKDYYDIYRPIKSSPEAIAAAGKSLYINLAEESYGFLQPLWFLLKMLLQRANIKLKGKNWFASGIVCSGVLYDYLIALGGEYAQLVSDTGVNNCTPEELYQKVLTRNDLFVLIGSRK